MDPPVLIAREDGGNDRKDQQAESLRALPLSTLKQVCRNGTEKELGGAQGARVTGSCALYADTSPEILVLVICTSFGTGWGEAGAMGNIEIGWRKELRVAEKSTTSPIRPLQTPAGPGLFWSGIVTKYLHWLGITIVKHDIDIHSQGSWR